MSSRLDDSLWVELQAIVRKQREAYDRSLLNNIGHGNIPVMAADVLPLEEAKENSAEFDLEILKLLQSL